MTYRGVVARGEEILRRVGVGDAALDAWLLLSLASGMDRAAYYMHQEEEIPDEQLGEYLSALKRRAEHVPLQYIAGETEFMGHRFKVNSAVLIPRQDTETLVEEALKAVRPGSRVLDLCTGSGCVIVSIICAVPDARGYAADISKQALNVARENARMNGVSVIFEQGDLFGPVAGDFDVIVANPPYIPTGEIEGLMPEVRSFEPAEALDGGMDGLDFYRRIAAEAGEHLSPGGQIFLEIGCDQGEAVSSLLAEGALYDVRVKKDLAGRDRVVAARASQGVAPD